ncbi:methyl-accepting chemotaxis protein [Alkalimarinus coralli]|uniref:methyl-accepting chemotaxis protein n=1 Tax=Alkalimarinus coralli TaxID=2935863 RepID=UPI00202BA2EB|nr:methyl-accepting chemotaxis protein [Alkalimarinus coralli]
MLTFFKSMVSSKLLKPVFAALIVISIVQVLLFIVLTSSNVNSLNHSIESGLKNSEQQITTQLAQTNSQVETLIQQMADKTGQSLSATLALNFEKEELIIEESFQYSLEQSSRTLATVLAQIAPPYIWDNDTPELTRIVEMAHQTDNVVFAIFLDKESKPLTRYLNRKDPIIKDLISSSQVRGSVNKVLEAAPKNNDISVIYEPINSRDVEIGKFVLGISNAQVVSEVQSLKDRFSKLINDSNKTVKETMREESVNVVAALQTSLKETTNDLGETISSSINTISSGATNLTVSLTTLVIIASLVTLLCMAFLLTKLVLNKINSLRKALWGIAEGEGDLTQRAQITGSDEITNMATALNRFIEKTQSIITEVNLAADNASNMTGTLANTANTANSAVNRQQNEIEQISSAISQMSSSIQHVAESIQTAAKNVEDIQSESSEASSISTQVNAQLNQLIRDITNANQVVMELETHSNQIGSVLDVIRGIAEQTNLLALNAAIEAARAGESGRGFAVVADEVRALASKTQQSTTEIQQSIEGLQEGSKSAVNAINTANRVAKESIDSFSNSDAHLESVSTSVTQLFDLSTEVASMAEEQTHVAEEINRNIVNINEATEQTASSVNRAAASSTEIDDVVKLLKDKVSQFKVE